MPCTLHTQTHLLPSLSLSLAGSCCVGQPAWKESRYTSMPGGSFAALPGQLSSPLHPPRSQCVRMPASAHSTQNKHTRAGVFQQRNPEPGLSLKVLSSPQHRRLSLSSQSQQGLALKATDFFFPLASHTKEGHFVNYLLVSDQQKVLSLSPPSPFDFAQIWLQGLKKEKGEEEEIKKNTDGVLIQHSEWLYLCLFKLWQSTAFHWAKKRELDKNYWFVISHTTAMKNSKKSFFFLPLPLSLPFFSPSLFSLSIACLDQNNGD